MSLKDTLEDIKNLFPETITNEFIDSMPRRPLTKDEEALDYSKYYFKKMTPIPQDDLDKVNAGSIDPKFALPISERNAMLEPGYKEVETGFCLMPDGSGYSATKVFMPGVTPQMLDWWFNWHPLENLRYAIWCPVAHSEISAETPDAHLDNSNVDLHVRNYGKSHFPIEGFDLAGATRLRIHFRSPEAFGLDMSKFKEPNISSCYAASVVQEGKFIKVPINVFMHSIREVEGGVEYRSRYWLGWTINKKDNIVRSKIKMPADAMYAMARSNCIHSLTEYNHLGAILPTIYEEQGGRIS